jgi:Polyketide cyclase / dehydrase and lipid transport
VSQAHRKGQTARAPVYSWPVASYRFSARAKAPPELVFDLWTNLERMAEWVGGVTSVTDISGPVDRAGTTYVTHFGRMRSPTQVLEADPPRRFVTRFGNWLLRGENATVFEPDGDGTLISEEFRTVGLIPAISARIFASGSYKGSFQGELNEFVRIAEREAAARNQGQ